jgi:hypothetical protein
VRREFRVPLDLSELRLERLRMASPVSECRL